MSMFWVLFLLALIPVFAAGWAARRGHDNEYIQARARYLAEQMPRPYLPYVEPAGGVFDAERVYAPSARLDRPELTR